MRRAGNWRPRCTFCPELFDLDLEEAAVAGPDRGWRPANVADQLAGLDLQSPGQFDHRIQTRGVMAQLEGADLGAMHRAEVPQFFLRQRCLFPRREQFHTEGLADAFAEVAHRKIVSVSQQSVYTMFPGGYFRLPVYTDPVFE